MFPILILDYLQVSDCKFEVNSAQNLLTLHNCELIKMNKIKIK